MPNSLALGTTTPAPEALGITVVILVGTITLPVLNGANGSRSDCIPTIGKLLESNQIKSPIAPP